MRRTGSRSASTTLSAFLVVVAAVGSLAVWSPARAAPFGATSGGMLFFTANDGVHGRELWSSDGTKSGTAMTKDIRPGPRGSRPTGLAQIAGTLYFSANDGVHGYELWKSDGTAAGTARVDDTRPGPKESRPAYLTAVDDTLFFVADDDNDHAGLWKSDGTAAGTVFVKEIHLSSFYPAPFVVFDGGLYFLADDGIHGSELWRSDGTAAGTRMVKDIFPGTGGFYPWIMGVTGAVFLYADDGIHGRELWKSDGTAAGTTLVKDIRPGRATSNGGRGGQSFAVMGSVLYFTASDDHVAYDDWVDELWRSDGTAAGTVKVADLAPFGANTDPFSLFADDALYLSNVGDVLTSDGTPDGAALLPSAGGWDFTESGGDVYYLAGGSHTFQLWKSDGTAAGTVVVRTFFVPGSYGSTPTHLTDMDARLLFAADDGTHGDELWLSDGTTVGTVMVKDINPGSAPSKPAALIAVSGAARRHPARS